MTAKLNLTGQILAVVRRNNTYGITVPGIVEKLERKFGTVDRQTVSSRVSALYRTYQLDRNGTVTNPETGRSTTVYVTNP